MTDIKVSFDENSLEKNKGEIKDARNAAKEGKWTNTMNQAAKEAAQKANERIRQQEVQTEEQKLENQRQQKEATINADFGMQISDDLEAENWVEKTSKPSGKGRSF